jgi:DNA-directed RNA polymerase subunit RPC12/RpoP
MADNTQNFKCALCSFAGSAYELGRHLVSRHSIDSKTALLALKEASKKLKGDFREDLRKFSEEFLGRRPAEVKATLNPSTSKPPELVKAPEAKPRSDSSAALYESMSGEERLTLKALKSQGAAAKAVPVGVDYDASVIDRLKRLGMIEASTIGRALRCPQCSSEEVKTIFKCPRCGGKNVDKKTLYQHQACGAFFTEPEEAEEGLRCPACHAPLTEGSSRAVGAWFECEDCGGGFEEPKVGFQCTKCLKEFDVQTSTYSREQSVKLSGKAIALLATLERLEALSKPAAEMGYDVRLFTTFKGASGIEHEFEAVLTKGSRTIVVSDLSLPQGEDAFQRIASITAKFYDVGNVGDDVRQLLIADSAGLNPSLRRLINSHRFKVIEASSSEQVSREVEEYLRSLDGGA